MVTAFAFSRVSLVWVTARLPVPWFRWNVPSSHQLSIAGIPRIRIYQLYLLAMLTRTGHGYNAGRGVVVVYNSTIVTPVSCKPRPEYIALAIRSSGLTT